MGKKKRQHPEIEEILARPWCYYCERDFDDLKILISHQKAKHYKCDKCGRRLNTAGGLSVHLTQVHKDTLTIVDNALPNRSAPDIEVFGMEGIPDDILAQHNARVSQEFFAAEAERRAVTGNPTTGSAAAGAQANSSTKRPKFESPAELKKRLAEHRAKKAAGESGAVSSDPNTPIAQSATPPVYQPPFPVPQGSPPQAGFPAPYGQPPPFFGQQQPPPFNSYVEAYGGPPSVQQGPFPPGQFGAPQPQYSPAQHYGDQPQPAGYPPGPPAAFSQYQPNHIAPPPSASPYSQQAPRPLPHDPPLRQSSLPSAPGLPQRPSFNAPPVSREQLAEMHSGNIAAANDAQGQQQYPQHHEVSANASSVDDLISSAAQQSAQTSNVGPPAAEKPAPAEKPTDGNAKKAKKASRLSYGNTNTDVGIEERVVSLPKYSFVPEKGEETYLAPVEAAVTGVTQGPDDVLDKQG
ncbi:hypothetical protein MBLNU459_g4316t1 [Dothideomycetes sp. NU459]